MFCSSLFAQQLSVDGIQESISRSRIKTKTEYVYFVKGKKSNGFKSQKRYYDEKGQDTLLEIFSITNRNVFSKVSKKFDSKGLLTEKREYKVTYDGINESLLLDNVVYFEYNDSGRIKYWKELDKDGNLLNEYKTDFKYSEKGKISESVTERSNAGKASVDEYEYDKQGAKKFYKYTDAKGKAVIITSFYNDSLGRAIGRVNFNSDGSVKSRESIKYNQKGKIVERCEFDADSTLLYRHVFRFNTNQDMTEYIRHPAKPGLEFTRIKMEYNERGDLERNTLFDSKNKPIKINKFLYTYY